MVKERDESKELLDIARLWHQHQHKAGVGVFLSQELGVGGRAVGTALKMIRGGLIAFEENGEPYYTVTPEKAKESAGISLSREDIAQREVVSTVEGSIRDESKTNTEQYLVLGKAIWQAVAHHFAKKGLTPQEIREMPIHRTVMEALEKADKYDELIKEHEALQQQVAFYENKLDPDIRLEKGLNLLTEALTITEFYRELGVDFPETRAGKIYTKLVDKYIIGVEI